MTFNTIDRRSPLRQARLDRRLRQDELAALAGVSRREIIRLEAGKCLPREATRRQLAAALGRRPADLFPPVTSSRAPASGAPQIARVGITLLRELRSLADVELRGDERRLLCERVAPELDHLIAVAEERGWPL